MLFFFRNLHKDVLSVLGAWHSTLRYQILIPLRFPYKNQIMFQSREHLLPATADHRIDPSDLLYQDRLIAWPPIVDHTMVQRQVILIQYTLDTIM